MRAGDELRLPTPCLAHAVSVESVQRNTWQTYCPGSREAVSQQPRPAGCCHNSGEIVTARANQTIQRGPTRDHRAVSGCRDAVQLPCSHVERRAPGGFFHGVRGAVGQVIRSDADASTPHQRQRRCSHVTPPFHEPQRPCCNRAMGYASIGKWSRRKSANLLRYQRVQRNRLRCPNVAPNPRRRNVWTSTSRLT